MPPLLFEAGVVFAALAVAGSLSTRVGQSVIPAYILAGLLLGPFSPVEVLSVVRDREFIALLRQLGVVLLLFFVGLEVDLSSLLAARDRVFAAGTIDLGLNGAVAAALALAFGFGAFETVLLVGIVALTSSVVVVKTLIDLGWIADPESEAVLSVLVFEDVVTAGYLAVLAALTAPADAAGVLARSAVVILLLAALVRYGRPLVDRALATASDEVFLLRVVGGVTLVGGIALAAGVSEAVAAFFLGSAVGTTRHAERVSRVITSERDLYAAVFFFAVGLGTDPGLIPGVAAPLVAFVVVSTLAKVAAGYLGGRAYGLDERRSVRVGTALVARGEFSLVVAAVALEVGATRVVALAVGYVLVMSTLGPLAMRYSGPIERAVQSRAGA